MLSPDLLGDLEAAWPAPRRGVFGDSPPSEVPPALEAVLQRVGASDEERGLPVLLLRANDWVGPVRDEALTSLHGLLGPGHVDAWLRALPLLLRLEACGRASHGPLVDRVGALFRETAARARLLAAARSLEAPAARAAASLALRVAGAGDREVVAALLRCPDTLVRYRVLAAATSTLDEGLLDLALADPVPGVRRRALEVLRSRDPRRFAAGALGAWLLCDPSPGGLWMLVQWLADPAAVLLAASWTPEWAASVAALGLLAHLSARHHWSACEASVCLRRPTATILGEGGRRGQLGSPPPVRE